MRYLTQIAFTCLFGFVLAAQSIAAPVTDRDLQQIWQRGDLSKMQMLAEKGDMRAQHWVGLMLHNRGRYDEAIDWYSRAVENGDAKSANRIAFFYERGIGRPKDLKAALAWHRKAAQLGDFSSQVTYAAALRHGEVLARDERGAFQWYSKAAAQRDYAQPGYAYLPIADMYVRGAGVRRDFGRAYAYAKAAELTVDNSDMTSQEDARSIYNKVAAQLPPAELATAERFYRYLASDALERLDRSSRIWNRRALVAGAWLVSLLAAGIVLLVIMKNRRTRMV